LKMKNMITVLLLYDFCILAVQTSVIITFSQSVSHYNSFDT